MQAYRIPLAVQVLATPQLTPSVLNCQLHCTRTASHADELSLPGESFTLEQSVVEGQEACASLQDAISVVQFLATLMQVLPP